MGRISPLLQQLLKPRLAGGAGSILGALLGMGGEQRPCGLGAGAFVAGQDHC